MKARGHLLSFSLSTPFNILMGAKAITTNFIFNSSNKKKGVIELLGLIII